MSHVTNQVLVDEVACQRVANILAQAAVPEDHEEVCLPLPPERIGNFYLGLVAICHQTQTLRGRVAGVPSRGWDYLQARWLEAVQGDPHLVTPQGWASLSADALTGVFADSDVGSTLTTIEARTRLLNDLGERMLQKGWESLCDLYELSGKRVATAAPNLVSLLGAFRAYNDPVRKKTFFLLGLMRNSAGWTYADADVLGAPVDYHEVRGHLRLGTVVVHDAQLREKLLKRISVDEPEDLALRACVAEAIRSIAQLAGLRDCIRLHYLFWNLFRSVCVREHPHCRTALPNEALPARYARFIDQVGSEGCPFSTVCPSANLNDRYLEHFFETDWY